MKLPQGFRIVQGQPEHVPLILMFIKELAEYEKMSDEVVATEKMLHDSLFGENKSCEVVVGFYNDEPVGFALYFHNYSTFLSRPGLYLEDLYVKPEMRGNGFGKALLHYLAALANKRGCGRMEWSVLNWNQPAIDFYKSLGAEPMDEWTVYRLADKALKAFDDFDD